MKVVLFAFAVAILASSTLADHYHHFYDHKVIKVEITNPLHIPIINKLELDVWSHDSNLVLGSNDIMVNALQEQMIKLLGVKYEVMIEDVEQRLEEERITLRGLAEQDAASWFDTYHPLDEIYALYQSLASSHPTLVRFNPSIGKSVQDRDIAAVSLGKAGATKKIYIEGGQHAREWIGHATVAYITNELVTRYATDATAKAILDTLEVVVVPVVNPDGYNYTWTTNRLWRKNRRANTGGTFGVDLNRNWDDHWGTVGTSHSPSSDTYCGTKAFSEPETTAVSNFIKSSGPFALGVDYHSYSQLILRPYGWSKTLPPNDAVAKLVGDGIRDVIANLTRVKYTSQPSWALYETSGSAQDWFYGSVAKIPLSYTIELRDTGTYGFQLPPAQIIPTGQENYAAFAYYATHVLKN